MTFWQVGAWQARHQFELEQQVLRHHFQRPPPLPTALSTA